MLCDICKQNVATVHLTQMVEGKTKKVDLCEACSKEKGVDDPDRLFAGRPVARTGRGAGNGAGRRRVRS